ncbi:MAG: hypothetical protein R3B72_16730 [Polyangiaceae bacterium]
MKRPLFRLLRALLTTGLAGGALLGALAGCDGCSNKPTPPPAATASAAVSGAPSASAVATAGPLTAVDAKVPLKCNSYCKINGRCGWHSGLGTCVARSDEDCRKSRACRVNGTCTKVEDSCHGTSEEDCKASERCKDEGLCHFVGKGPTNCFAKEDADCAETKVCKEQNRCSAIDGFCEDKDHPRKVKTDPGSKPL